MKVVHTFSIALLLAVAAGLGAAAATQTLRTAHAQAPSASAAATPAAATPVAGRTARLDRWQRQLQRALHRRLPKLPPLVHFSRVAAPAVSAAPLISQVSQAPAAPRTIYVHAKPSPTAARSHGHEHEGSDGGGHDD